MVVPDRQRQPDRWKQGRAERAPTNKRREQSSRTAHSDKSSFTSRSSLPKELSSRWVATSWFCWSQGWQAPTSTSQTSARSSSPCRASTGTRSGLISNNLWHPKTKSCCLFLTERDRTSKTITAMYKIRLFLFLKVQTTQK